MKKTILVLCLLLAGCANQKLTAVTTATVTQDQVDAARSGYNGAFLAPLHRYALLPKCLSGQDFIHDNCHDAASLIKLRSVDKQVAQDFADLQALMRSGNVNAISAAWTILNNAISGAKSTASALGLN